MSTTAISEHQSSAVPQFGQARHRAAPTTEGHSSSIAFPPSSRRGRAPAVAVAACFAAGIALDGAIDIEWRIWFAASVILLVLWAVSFRRRCDRIANACLLAACLLAGGARHHVAMSTAAANDISLYAREESFPVHLVGTIATDPETRVLPSVFGASEGVAESHTQFQLRCASIESDGHMRPVSGLAQLQLNGALPGFDVGDTVDVRGRLSRPSPPANPGQFDYADFLRRQGMRCLVRLDYPDAVVQLDHASAWQPARCAARLREVCTNRIYEHLSPKSAPVAAALLLGDRTQVDDEIRDAFVHSGTMHIMAISGINVAILAGLLWMACRLFNLSVLQTSAVLGATVIGYAFLTGGNPPVVRATVWIAIVIAGRMSRREAIDENSLAIAAIVILGWNPSNLFDAGSQLSFIAAAAIMWSSRWNIGKWKAPTADRHLTASLMPSKRHRWVRALLTGTLRVYVVSATIWLVTAPLLMDKFHLVSPVGLLVNVLIIPFVTVVLWAGYVFLLCGLLLPFLAPVLGWIFDVSLAAMLWLVESAAGVGWSHLFVPSPPTWWLAGFYVSLIGLFYPPLFGLSARIRWGLLCLWIAVGLGSGLCPPPREGLRCTFLAVGHGCSTVIELPDGRTILYDAGSLSGGRSAQRRIEGALWNRGISRLDAIVISHADIDHFNGVSGLLRTLQTGCLITARPFLDFHQQQVQEMCEAAADANVPIRIIAAGDRLALDPEVNVVALHPRREFRSEKDNANSLALALEYAGRRILLTGDLEADGLDELLSRSSQKVDVLLSPHHGSRGANTVQLAEWAQQPPWIVVSTGQRRRAEALAPTYGSSARILPTAEQGAVTIEIDPRGVIRESHHR
ncbi:MAG: DNA internalization-related competence protein ComEC/Rec2 [Planctomycetaceae bacterium]